MRKPTITEAVRVATAIGTYAERADQEILPRLKYPSSRSDLADGFARLHDIAIWMQTYIPLDTPTGAVDDAGSYPDSDQAVMEALRYIQALLEFRNSLASWHDTDLHDTFKTAKTLAAQLDEISMRGMELLDDLGGPSGRDDKEAES